MDNGFPEVFTMYPAAYSRILLSPLLVFIAAVACNAQAVVFTAAANASKIGVQDQLQVTYTVQDAPGLRSLNPGTAFKDFRILAGPFQSQTSNTEIVGNRMVQTSSVTFTFVLQPKRTGTLTLAPTTASDGSGHSYQSNALQVEVVPGSLAARRPRAPAQQQQGDDDFFGGSDPFAAVRQQQQAMMQQMRPMNGGQTTQPGSAPVQKGPAPMDLSRDIFIRVDVDKKAVKIGEQITATYKLYARLPMQVSISRLPSLNGFWTQDFDIPRQPKPVDEVVNGKHYQVFVLKKSALFPQQPGTLVLDPAEAEGTARVAQQTANANPFDDPFFKQAFGGSLLMSDPFFSDPFGGLSYQDVPVHTKSAPVTIKVSELPEEGRPADYTGAVGDFKVAAKIDKETMTTDDVATLTFTVSGSGNLKLFTAPKLALPAGLDAYDPSMLDTITGRSTTISGEKIVKYTIAARRAGEYAIRPVTLSWYDPQSGSYKTASTAGFRLRVKEGSGMPAAAKGNAKGRDIEDSTVLSMTGHPLILSPVYWGMYALPLLGLLFVSVYRRRADVVFTDTVQTRNKLANKVAQKRLATAGARMAAGDGRAFYDEVSKALWLYLSDKLGIPMSALGKGSTAQALLARGVLPTVQAQIDKVIGTCELALYTPGGGGAEQMQQTFSEAASVITSLERTLSNS